MNEKQSSACADASSPAGSAASGQNSDFSFSVDKYALLKDLYGDRYVEYRRRWSPDCDEGPTEFPLEIDLVINDVCNLRCGICPVEERNKSGGHRMSAEILERVRSEAVEHGACSMDLSGMEPFLYPDTFLETVAMAKKTPIMDFFIHTNGTRFTDATLDAVVDPRVTTLNVSIDAATRETYGAVRGGNDFDRIRRGLEQIAELKEKRGTVFPLVQLSFVVNPLNHHEKHLFEENWRGLAQSYQYQSYLWNKGVNLEPTDEFVPSIRPPCREPDIRCLVAPNGDVYPCCTGFKEELRLGNILESTLYEMWHGEKAASIRRFLKGEGEMNYRDCSVCLRSVYVLRDGCPH